MLTIILESVAIVAVCILIIFPVIEDLIKGFTGQREFDEFVEDYEDYLMLNDLKDSQNTRNEFIKKFYS